MIYLIIYLLIGLVTCSVMCFTDLVVVFRNPHPISILGGILVLICAFFFWLPLFALFGAVQLLDYGEESQRKVNYSIDNETPPY